MPHQITFKGTVLTLPGAASFTDANRLATAGLAGAGVVGVIGEAEGGEGYDGDAVHLVTRENAQAAKDLFRSGDIVDAISLAFQPANDPNVPGGANSLLVVRVNAAVQSALILDDGGTPVDLIDLTSVAFGLHANLVSVIVASVVVGTGTGRVYTLQFDNDDPIVSDTIAVQDASDLTEAGDVKWTVQYTGAGTPATMVITATELTVAVTGGADPSDSFTLDIVNEYKTVQQVVDYFNTRISTDFTAVAVASDSDVFLMTDLDQLGNTTPEDILAAVFPSYASVFDSLAFFNNFGAEHVTAVAAAGAAEDETQPAALPQTFFTGGTAGAALANTDWQASFDLLKTVDCEHVVSLLSADSGGVTISSINAQGDAHAAEKSNPGGNSERTFWGSIGGTKVDVKAQLSALNSFHSVLVAQQLQMLDGTGSIKFFDEWGFAMIGACMRSGVAEEALPLTHKFIRASGIQQDATWNPSDDGAELLLAGLFMAESVPGLGIRIIKGVTTYTKADNLALIDESQVNTWKAIQKRIRNRLVARFIGQKGLVVTIQGVKQEIVAGLEEERTDRETITDSILADGTVVRAYTNPVVGFTGGTVDYTYGVKVVGGINFITGTQTLEPVTIIV